MVRRLSVFLLVCMALGLWASQAAATVRFYVVITEVNGAPIAPTTSVAVGVGDTLRAELRADLEAGDVVDALSMAQIFDPSVFQMIGPLEGPLTFHQTCAADGIPCTTLISSVFSAPSGGTTPDSNPNGDVGSMGVAAFLFGPGTFDAPQSGSLGLVDFEAVGESLGSGIDAEPFSVADGAFTDSGLTPVPFTVEGATVMVPEPAMASVAGALAVFGLGGLRRRNRSGTRFPEPL